MLGRSGPIDWLIVCLGNPGDQYSCTRHNMGYLVGDVLAERHRIRMRRVRFHALCGDGTVCGQRVLLMKPQTYMNRSGTAVGEAVRFYKLPPQRVLTLVDDIALPPGRIRIRQSGSAGGHNGLKDLIAHLGTDDFPRIKIGVGAPPHPDYDQVDWVLGVPQGDDRAAIGEALVRAADAVDAILQDGFDKAMTRYNTNNTK
ncbi:MAG: aminoacyl-tRNA hydrolase [Oscillospiraceae bacterium]|nr:aminoacyl-tRNA hydrolase [Oscillospiraceae bacterium]